MGTWVDAIVEEPGSGRVADEALASIEKMLRAYERDYYAWSATGELAELNSAIAASQAFDVSPEMAGLLTRAKSIAETSEHFFDPGVGGLVELWGFHSSLEVAAEPPAEAIDAWLAASPRISDLDINGTHVSSSNPELKIDLGGIAKGEAVDRAIELLRDAGVENALVNAGGDLRVIGTHAERRWRVGIKAPRGDGLLGYVELDEDEAAFTSGDYERYFDTDGKRMHHILDARTGYPATQTEAVTVLARDGVTADAAATALFVAGPGNWRRIAAQLGIEYVLRVDASGRIEMSDAMRSRLEPMADGSNTESVEGS